MNSVGVTSWALPPFGSPKWLLREQLLALYGPFCHCRKLFLGGTIFWYDFMAGAQIVPKNRPTDRKEKRASSLSCTISRQRSGGAKRDSAVAALGLARFCKDSIESTPRFFWVLLAQHSKPESPKLLVSFSANPLAENSRP